LACFCIEPSITPPSQATPTASVTAPSPTATSTATVADFSGTYDDVATARDGGGAIAEFDGGALEIDANIFESYQLRATPAAGESLVLDGFEISGGDIFITVTGTAALASRGDEQRIDVSLKDQFGSTRTFLLTRPMMGASTSFAGTYVFVLANGPSGCSCPSAATLDLSVDADGKGILGGGTDVDLSAGAAVGSFAPGMCSISPRGRLHCVTTYTTPGRPLAEAITWHGILPSGVRDGSGEMVRGLPIFTSDVISWSSARASP